jgi:hypothetical protein
MWLTAAFLWLIRPDRAFEVFGLLQFLIALFGAGLAVMWRGRKLESSTITVGISVACLFVGGADPGRALLALEFAFGWLLVAVIQSLRMKQDSATQAG